MKQNKTTESAATVALDLAARKLIDDASLAAASSLVACVRPLLIVNDRGDPEPHASSVLLAIDDRYFLLSAAHAFDLAGKTTFLIATDTDLIPFEGTVHRTGISPAGTRDRDRLDVAFAELTLALAGRIGAPKFLSVTNLDPNEISGPSRAYLILGYPVTRVRRDRKTKVIRRELMVYSNQGVPSTAYQKLGLEPFVHLAVKFDRKRVIERGVQCIAPKLTGLSGCGVWRFDSLLGEGGGLGGDKLVAILNEHEPSNPKVLVATRVSVYLAAIGMVFPALANSIPKLRRARFNVQEISEIV